MKLKFIKKSAILVQSLYNHYVMLKSKKEFQYHDEEVKFRRMEVGLQRRLQRKLQLHRQEFMLQSNKAERCNVGIRLKNDHNL